MTSDIIHNKIREYYQNWANYPYRIILGINTYRQLISEIKPMYNYEIINLNKFHGIPIFKCYCKNMLNIIDLE